MFTSVMTGAKVLVPALEPVSVRVRLPLNWLMAEPVATAVGLVAVTVPPTVAVNGVLMVMLVLALMAVMVAPSGMPAPLTDWPTAKPVVLAVVMVVEPLAPPVVVMAIGARAGEPVKFKVAVETLPEASRVAPPKPIVKRRLVEVAVAPVYWSVAPSMRMSEAFGVAEPRPIELAVLTSLRPATLTVAPPMRVVMPV